MSFLSTHSLCTFCLANGTLWKLVMTQATCSIPFHNFSLTLYVIDKGSSFCLCLILTKNSLEQWSPKFIHGGLLFCLISDNDDCNIYTYILLHAFSSSTIVVSTEFSCSNLVFPPTCISIYPVESLCLQTYPYSVSIVSFTASLAT